MMSRPGAWLTLLCLFLTLSVPAGDVFAQDAEEPAAAAETASNNGDTPDVIRYQVAIPVSELQVRQQVQEHSERQGMWELVHCRSEKEGRPERVYQYQRYPSMLSVLQPFCVMHIMYIIYPIIKHVTAISFRDSCLYVWFVD